MSRQTLAYVSNAFVRFSLLGQELTLESNIERQIEGKPLLRCERSERVCVLLCEWQFPAEAMECSSVGEGSSQGETVRERVRARERFLAPLQRLVWIAKIPQNPGLQASAVRPGI